MDGRIKVSSGSITVFFACFFPLFMALFAALYTLADCQIAKTLSSRLIRSSCSSVLGEFDRKLEQKYGLYAIKREAQCAFAVDFYLEENLRGGSLLGLPAPELRELSVISQRDLSSLSEVRKQISAFMEYRRYAGWAQELLDAVGILNSGLEEEIGVSEAAESAGESQQGPDLDDIFPRSEFEWKKYVDNANKLAASGILKGELPSYTESLSQEEPDETDESSFAQILLDKLKNIGAELLQKTDLVLYCTGMFSDFSDSVAAKQNRDRALSLREREKTPGFFQNEVEYILWGFGNESANVRATKYEVVALRILFNLAAFSLDPIMMERLLSLAEEVAELFGAEAGAAAAKILMISWCWAEAEADFKHLALGDRVPAFKSDSQWETGSYTYIQPEKGWDYNDHLKILLALVPSSRLLARVSDLIYLEEEGSIGLDDYVCAFSVKGSFRKGWVSYSFDYAAGF